VEIQAQIDIGLVEPEVQAFEDPGGDPVHRSVFRTGKIPGRGAPFVVRSELPVYFRTDVRSGTFEVVSARGHAVRADDGDVDRIGRRFADFTVGRFHMAPEQPVELRGMRSGVLVPVPPAPVRSLRGQQMVESIEHVLRWLESGTVHLFGAQFPEGSGTGKELPRRMVFPVPYPDVERSVDPGSGWNRRQMLFRIMQM